MREVIWQDADGLQIVASDRPDARFIAHLARVAFGTGGNAYWRLNVAEQLGRFERPAFVSLRDDQHVIGTYVLDEQPLRLDGQEITGIYRGLLSVAPERRHAGLGRELAGHGLRWMSARAGVAGQPVLSYGVVDRDNERSLALLDAIGMQPIGSLAAMVQYRQRRGRHIETLAVTAGLSDEARAARREQTAGAGLHGRNAGGSDWITVSDARGNVAACRHHLTELKLAPMRGAAGFVTEKLMPLFPPGHRRFNPKRFRYVSISDAVVPAGSAALWRQLLPHLMAVHETHFATFTLDPQSTAAQRLRAAGVIGRTAWRKRSNLRVMAGAHDEALALTPTTIGVSARDL